MSVKPCPHEKAVTAAARSGEWTPELRAHRDGCLTCAELTLVVAVLSADAEELATLEKPLPDPGVIWLKSRLASRTHDYVRATRAITWVQRATVAVVVAVGLAFVPELWGLVSRVYSHLSISAPDLDLPRSAGSPLLVLVVSMLVLGLLAVFELTATGES